MKKNKNFSLRTSKYVILKLKLFTSELPRTQLLIFIVMQHKIREIILKISRYPSYQTYS